MQGRQYSSFSVLNARKKKADVAMGPPAAEGPSTQLMSQSVPERAQPKASPVQPSLNQLAMRKKRQGVSRSLLAE